MHALHRGLPLAVVFALALVPVAACDDLPALESNVCGNGVRDFNEDCDSFPDPELGPGTTCAPASDSVRACRYVCSAAEACPTGWGCGPDGVCRYASGQFVPGPDSPLRMDALRIEIGDFDGDALPDVIGFAGPSISIRFSTSDGRFPSEFVTSTALPLGDQALADMDEDGRTDLVVPLLAGIFVMLGQSTQTLAPVAYAPFAIPDALGGIQTLPLRVDDDSPFDGVLLLVANCMTFQIEGGGDCAATGTLLPLRPGIVGTPFLAREISGRVPRADIDAQGVNTAEEIALAFSDATDVFIYRSIEVSAGVFQMQLSDTVALLGGEEVLFGARFADLNADGRMDLLVSVGQPGDDHVAIALGDGAGHFSDAVVDDTFLQLGVLETPGKGPAISTQNWPLATGDFNGDGVADYVSQNGIHLRFGSALYQTAFRSSPDLWAEAEVADFNRDGFLDVAAVAEGIDDVDFYTGTGQGVFNPTRLATDGPPFFLRSGDFNGDLINDLAIGEQDPITGRGNDSLSILFGNLQGPPSPPESMGRLQRIEFLEPMRLVTDAANIDLISDMIVQSQASLVMPDDRSLAIMFGSTQGRLISPFSLQAGEGKQSPPFAVLAGRFDPGGDTIPDLIAVAPPDLWSIKGAGDAEFNAQDAQHQPLDGLFGAGGNTAFDPLCAIYARADLDGDGRDQIIGLDQTQRCGAGFGMSATPRLMVVALNAGSGAAVVLEDVPGGFTNPGELSLADLNDDGQLDLIAVFLGDRSAQDGGPGGGVAVEHAGVVVYWGANGTIDTSDPSVVPVFDGATLRVSAAAINADEDKRLELAVLTDAGVYITNFDDQNAFDAPGFVTIEVPGQSIRAADVNADGLADLLLADTNGENVFVYLAVPHLDAIVADGTSMPGDRP